MAGKRINDRQTLSEQARDLGIDPRGMNASEKKEAIKDKKEENEVKKQAEDAMGQFVREQLALDKAEMAARAPVAPTMPTVTVAPVVESSTGTSGGGIEPVKTGFGGGSIGSSDGGNHPFKITSFTEEDVDKYIIATGSITDGTNGDAIDLGGIIGTTHSASSGYVVISAVVDESLELSDWDVSVMTEADAAMECVIGSGSQQGGLRLLLGKLTPDSTGTTVSQALFTSVRVTHGILNGAAVRVFEAAPTHPGSL